MITRIKSARAGGAGRSIFTDEAKIHALENWIVDKKPASAIMTELYESVDRRVPQKPGVTLGQWKKAYNSKLISNDQATLKMVRELAPGLLEQVDDGVYAAEKKTLAARFSKS